MQSGASGGRRGQSPPWDVMFTVYFMKTGICANLSGKKIAPFDEALETSGFYIQFQKTKPCCTHFKNVKIPQTE